MKHLSHCLFVLLSFVCTFSVEASENATEGSPVANPAAEMDETSTWPEVRVGKASFRLPPSMEVQGGNYGRIKEGLFDVIHIDRIPDGGLIIQQHGLNNMTTDAFNRYMRVIYKVVDEPEACKMGWTRTNVPPAAVDASEENGEKLRQLLPRIGSKMNRWDGACKVDFGPYSAICQAFQKQKGTKPPVEVRIYEIVDGNKAYVINFSYRAQERDFWVPDFERLVKTFRLE